MSSYTEKYCAAIPLTGPAAEHFVALSLALSGRLSRDSFEKIPEDVRHAVLDDLAEMSTEEYPLGFMAAIKNHNDGANLFPSSSGHASITLFDNEDDCMEGFQDNDAFTLIRDRDQLFVSHVDGYPFSGNIPYILSTTLDRYAQDQVVTIRYAADGESIQTDSFGGGAVAISRHGSRSCSSYDAEHFAELLLVGDEKDQGGQYQDQRNLVNRFLETLTAEEQQKLLGTFLHVIKDLAPVVSERLENERSFAVTDYSPS